MGPASRITGHHKHQTGLHHVCSTDRHSRRHCRPLPPNTHSPNQLRQRHTKCPCTQVTALVRDNDEIEEALSLGASSGMTSARAFDELKGTFDVILNCATARLEWSKASMRARAHSRRRQRGCVSGAGCMGQSATAAAGFGLCDGSLTNPGRACRPSQVLGLLRPDGVLIQVGGGCDLDTPAAVLLSQPTLPRLAAFNQHACGRVTTKSKSNNGHTHMRAHACRSASPAAAPRSRCRCRTWCSTRRPSQAASSAAAQTCR